MGGNMNALLSLGLRWQSLIVSPERQAWMKPPEVPAGEKHRWWGRLRDVPAAWVSSRGESERFLYYDGPTTARAPVSVKLRGDFLAFAPAEMFPKSKDVSYDTSRNHDVFAPLPQTARPSAYRRRGLFVEVRDGRASGRVIEVPGEAGRAPVSAADTVAGADKLRAALVSMLVEYGLTAEEAGGLADCWAPQFFRAAGRRFLVLLSAGDYDAMCPMIVEPPPTELVRAGILLCEFPEPPAAPVVRPSP
jgi:hypothetical protein